VLSLGTTDWSRLRKAIASVLLTVIIGTTATAAGLETTGPDGVSVAELTASGGGAGARALADARALEDMEGLGEDGGPVAVSRPGRLSRPLTESEFYLLARLISAESRGEPFLGQVAVGAVIFNRVESDLFPDTLAGVIYEPGQFEPVYNGQIDLEPTESALLAAELAAAGEDPSGGALYFFAPAKTSNAFLWGRPHKITIGKHRFTA